jgi:hypothetical protein
MKRENPTSIDTEAKTDSRYNGWTNYETWVVKLWIDNDQGTQEYWLEQAQEAQATFEDSALQNLANALYQSHADYAAERLGQVNDVFADLLTAALDSVNWREIAANLMEEQAEILS